MWDLTQLLCTAVVLKRFGGSVKLVMVLGKHLLMHMQAKDMVVLIVLVNDV